MTRRDCLLKLNSAFGKDVLYGDRARAAMMDVRMEKDDVKLIAEMISDHGTALRFALESGSTDEMTDLADRILNATPYRREVIESVLTDLFFVYHGKDCFAVCIPSDEPAVTPKPADNGTIVLDQVRMGYCGVCGRKVPVMKAMDGHICRCCLPKGSDLRTLSVRSLRRLR